MIYILWGTAFLRLGPPSSSSLPSSAKSEEHRHFFCRVLLESDNNWLFNLAMTLRGFYNTSYITQDSQVTNGDDSEVEGGKTNVATWVWISILSVALFLQFLYMYYASLRHDERLRRLGAMDHENNESSSISPSRQRKLDRLKLAEDYLITRKVRSHSGQNPCVHCSTSSTSLACTTDDSSAEEEIPHDQQECPICYDEFAVGQLVSWSPNKNCNHVFHHHCLKHWCMRKKECPFCRQTLLLPDSDKDEVKGDFDATVASTNEILCIYCAKHGVVNIDAGREASDCLKAILQHDVPTQPEMEALRPIFIKKKRTDTVETTTSSEGGLAEPPTSDLDQPEIEEGLPSTSDGSTPEMEESPV